MADDAPFWARAEHNRALAAAWRSQGEYAWALTAAFYAAVHYVNCLLIRDTRYSSDLDHHKTRDYLNNRHGALLPRYNELFGKGWRARYEASWQPEDHHCVRAERLLADIQDYVGRVRSGSVPGR